MKGASRQQSADYFVKSARPDQQGKYEIRGLPAGEYLAVAIDYVEEGMWNEQGKRSSPRGTSEAGFDLR